MREAERVSKTDRQERPYAPQTQRDKWKDRCRETKRQISFNKGKRNKKGLEIPKD